jgi:hypothetical protein
MSKVVNYYHFKHIEFEGFRILIFMKWQKLK